MRRDPYGIVQVIAYFGYELVRTYVPINFDAVPATNGLRMVTGEKIHRDFTHDWEKWIAHRTGVRAENKVGFLYLDIHGQFHYVKLHDFTFSHLAWYARDEWENQIPGNFGEGSELVLAAYREHLANPVKTPILVKHVNRNDFAELCEQFVAMTPIGSVRYFKGSDGSLWKGINCGDDGVRSSRL